MNSNIRKILVIYKKSNLQLAKEHNNKQILTLLEKKDPSVSNWLKADKENSATIATLKTHFETSRFFEKVDFRYRANVDLVKNYDLVITVGGDGTFLWGSKLVGSDIPILGINSDPSSSVGFFTCMSKDQISADLDRLILQKSGNRKQVQRLKVSVNGEIVRNRILNDILFAASHPAAMTNYVLCVFDNIGGVGRKNLERNLVEENQRSSGIWISSASGSTGANLSAGGWILPLDDKRAQYVVREPMRNLVWGTEHRYVHGFFTENSSLRIVNKTRKAILACDGTTGCIPVTTGDHIEISISDETLTIIGK